MASKPEKSHRQKKPHSTAEYYKLNTQAVEDLASADVSNSPEVSPEERERYGASRKGVLPNWLKVCFAKFWFAGAVEFFMITGLVLIYPGIRVPENMVLIVGIVMGMVTDLLTNNVLRFMAYPEGANDRWMMFSKKRFLSFFFNILYAMVLVFLVLVLYAAVNWALNALFAGGEPIGLDIEPLLFGLFYLLCDLAFVGLKNLVIHLVSSRKNKNVQEG